ncbi:hypothetical protein SCYAM73S_07211 [Streptomyces cyaneofuscatus]
MSTASTTVPTTTYLELSQEGAGAHKFYEVTVDGLVVTVRYGRIGAAGQVQTSTFATVAKAQAAAAKKVEKVRKGYAPAVPGQRAPRAVTRRQVTSAPSTARAVAPVLWRFRTGSSAFGIHVDDERCWVGNQAGDVYTLDHDGAVLARFSLPDGVKCLVADDFWIYAGCDDGRVYDLSSKLPFAAYDIAADVDIFWLDIHEGVLNVSDRDGRLTVIDHEDEHQWARRSQGEHAWMVRADDRGVYHGHHRGVTAYAPDGGGELWHTPTRGGVLFGWQEDDAVYADGAPGGPAAGEVERRDRGHVRLRQRGLPVRHLARRAVRLRGRRLVLRVLLRPGRHAPVEARYGRRVGAVHAVPRRAALPGDDGRLAGLRGRERGGHLRGPGGHGARAP